MISFNRKVAFLITLFLVFFSIYPVCDVRSQTEAKSTIDLEKEDVAPFDEKFSVKKTFPQEVNLLSVYIYETTRDKKLPARSFNDIQKDIKRAIREEIKYNVRSENFYRRMKFDVRKESNCCEDKLSNKQIEVLNDSINKWTAKYETEYEYASHKAEYDAKRVKAGFTKNDIALVEFNVTACSVLGTRLETEVETKEGKTTVTIHSDPLPPGKFFHFVIVTTPKTTDLSDLSAIVDTLYAISNSGEESTKVQARKKRLIAKYDGYFSRLDTQNCLESGKMSFETFEALYNHKILPELTKISNAEKELRASSKSSRGYYISKPCIATLFDNVPACDTCKLEYGLVTLRRKDVANAIANLSQCGSDTNYIYGFLSLANDHSEKKIKSEDYKARIKNLEKSLVILNQLIKFDCLILDKDTNRCGLVLKNIRSCFETALKQLQVIDKSRTAIETVLSGELLLSQAFISGTNTFVYDLKTRAGYSLFPDIGVIYAARHFKNPLTPIFTETSFSPYLGFVVNLRPINQKIPFKRGIYPGLTRFSMHRWTFNAGLTLLSLGRVGEVEDFFSKKSLLTGLGYRIGGGVTFHMGSLWFRRLDPNPLIDKRRLGAAPYAALSIDIKLQEFLGGVSSIFK